MSDDYRNTKYCPDLTDIQAKKKEVQTLILSQHSRAKDMHTYISDNNMPFKKEFVKAYNGKCAYCGVSLDILSWKLFEIDHFIPKEDSRFKTKKEAGYIENLVLSCYDCNRSKRDFVVPDQTQEKVHPDGDYIKKSFVRDDNYYIRVSDTLQDNADVQAFYKQLDLVNESHRLDYLLMNMRGLQQKFKDKPAAYSLLGDAINLLQRKRNISH